VARANIVADDAVSNIISATGSTGSCDWWRWLLSCSRFLKTSLSQCKNWTSSLSFLLV